MFSWRNTYWTSRERETESSYQVDQGSDPWHWYELLYLWSGHWSLVWVTVALALCARMVRSTESEVKGGKREQSFKPKTEGDCKSGLLKSGGKQNQGLWCPHRGEFWSCCFLRCSSSCPPACLVLSLSKEDSDDGSNHDKDKMSATKFTDCFSHVRVSTLNAWSHTVLPTTLWDKEYSRHVTDEQRGSHIKPCM